MTKSQERALNKIRRLVDQEIKGIRGDRDDKEIKVWEVDENEYFVSVIVEYGYKNDEGTMASIICRDRAHLFIGKRGGITYPVSKKLKNGTWKHYSKEFKGYSILQAVVDQH